MNSELDGERGAASLLSLLVTAARGAGPLDAILRVDHETGEAAERVEEVQEAVVQYLDCMHDQPHLTVDEGRVVAIGDRWERMVAGKPFVASCTVTVDQDLVESCSGPRPPTASPTHRSVTPAPRVLHPRPVPQARRGPDHLHLLVELYARTEEEAIDVLEEAARGALEITSLAEESRPPAHSRRSARLPGTGH